MNDLEMADEYPSEADKAVLKILRREGRANPKLIREETGLDKGDVNTVLVRASRHGDVRQVTRGLYDYTGDDATDCKDRLARAERELENAIQAMDRNNGHQVREHIEAALQAIRGTNNG